jgi:hypothetical protein
MAKYYDGKIMPVICEHQEPKRYEFCLHYSDLLTKAMPEEQIKQLAAEWADKAMQREAERTNTVWTMWGEVIIYCDFENYEIIMAFASELED